MKKYIPCICKQKERRYNNINFRQNISFSLKSEKQPKGQRIFHIDKSTMHQKEIRILNFY